MKCSRHVHVLESFRNSSPCAFSSTAHKSSMELQHGPLKEDVGRNVCFAESNRHSEGKHPKEPLKAFLPGSCQWPMAFDSFPLPSMIRRHDAPTQVMAPNSKIASRKTPCRTKAATFPPPQPKKQEQTSKTNNNLKIHPSIPNTPPKTRKRCRHPSLRHGDKKAPGCRQRAGAFAPQRKEKTTYLISFGTFFRSHQSKCLIRLSSC